MILRFCTDVAFAASVFFSKTVHKILHIASENGMMKKTVQEGLCWLNSK